MTPSSAFAEITKFAGAKDKQIVGQILNGLDFLNDVRTARRVPGTGMLLPKMKVNKGNRPLNFDVLTADGTNRDFSGRKLFVKPGMKVIRIVPMEAFQTFMDEGMDPKKTELPMFAQWVWQQEMNKISADINDNIYHSVFKADATAYSGATAYVGGTDYMLFTDNHIYKCVTTTTAGQTPITHPAKWSKVSESVISEGWGSIIAGMVSGSECNVTSTGALTSSNALSKVDLMYKDMTPAHRRIGGVFYLSSDNYLNYLEEEKVVFPMVLNQTMGDGKKYVYGSGKKWEVREATWLGTSGRVIATQSENLIFGTNLESDMTSIGEPVKDLHGANWAVKWLQGCEISDGETLYVNDQL
jgi:hypothetical protein